MTLADKTGASLDASDKLQKPAGWTPPNHLPILTGSGTWVD
jgi:hypothetical protein